MLTACLGPNLSDYASNTPKFDIRKHLNGDLEAWGGFFSFSGKADPLLYVKMTGTWQGNDGTLSEEFKYSDGRTQHREWKIHFIDDTNFTATASDVVGTAKGRQEGNAVNMKYVLTVKTKEGKSYNLSMDDWLYLVDDNHIINRNTMHKFGIKVGELIMGFKKVK